MLHSNINLTKRCFFLFNKSAICSNFYKDQHRVYTWRVSPINSSDQINGKTDRRDKQIQNGKKIQKRHVQEKKRKEKRRKKEEGSLKSWWVSWSSLFIALLSTKDKQIIKGKKRQSGLYSGHQSKPTKYMLAT